MRSQSFTPAIAALLLSGVLTLGLVPPAQAQEEDLSSNPGYIDLSQIESWFNAKANIEVNLRGSLLNFIASASSESEPEFAGLVNKLKAIQVRGFPLTNANANEVARRFEEFSNELESSGWQRVVYIREDQENVSIYMKPQGESIAGLTVMATDPSDDRSIFINIVGSINPEEIGKIGRGLDIEPMKNIDTTKSQNGH